MTIKENFCSNIIQIFLDFIDQKPKLLQEISHSSMSLTSNCWKFTLPELHRLAQSLDPQLSDLTYQSFRKLLFNSPINDRIKKKGGEIIIFENKNQVDRSTYAIQFTNN